MVRQNGPVSDPGGSEHGHVDASGVTASAVLPERKSAAIELLARQALLRVAHEAHAHGHGLNHIDRAQWNRFEAALMRRVIEPHG